MKFGLESLWENSSYEGVTIPGLCTIKLNGLRMNYDDEYALIDIKGKKTLCEWDTKGSNLSISINFAKILMFKYVPIDLSNVTLKIKLIDPSITFATLNGITFSGEISHVIDSMNPLLINITKSENVIEDYPTQFLDYPKDLTDHLLQQLEGESSKLNLSELESLLTYEIYRAPQKEGFPPMPLSPNNLSIIRRKPLFIEAVRYCGQYIEEVLDEVLKDKGLLKEDDTFAFFKRDSNNQILVSESSTSLAYAQQKTAVNLLFRDIDFTYKTQEGYTSSESYYRSASPITFITECFLDFILEKYKPNYIRRYELDLPYSIQNQKSELVKNQIISDRNTLFHELNHIFSGGGTPGSLGHGDFPTDISLGYKDTMVELMSAVNSGAIPGALFGKELYYPYINAFNIIKNYRLRRIDKSIKFSCKLRELIYTPDSTVDTETGERYKYTLRGQFYKENSTQLYPSLVTVTYDKPHGEGYFKSFFTTIVKPDGSFKLSLPYMTSASTDLNTNTRGRMPNINYTFLTTSPISPGIGDEIPINERETNSVIDQNYRDNYQKLLTAFNNYTEQLYQPAYDTILVPPLFPNEDILV